MPARVKVHDKQNRRVHVIRKAFRDAENMAMEAFGLSPAGEGDDPDMDDPTEGDKDDDNHTHVHIHMGGGEDGPKQAAAAADDADPDADPAAADPNASLADRVTALEGSMQQIVGLLNEIKDGAGKGTPPPAEKTEPPPQAKTDDADPEEEKDPEEKEPTKTMDSAALENDFAATVALAEVLAPGFRAPTFDAAMPRAKTVDRMCQLRRKALDMAYATTEGHDLINTVHGKAKDQDIDLTAMACDEVSALFKSAAGARSLLNNRASVGDGKAPVDKPSIFGTRDASKQLPAVKSVNDLNGFYAKYYGQKKA